MFISTYNLVRKDNIKIRLCISGTQLARNDLKHSQLNIIEEPRYGDDVVYHIYVLIKIILKIYGR